MRGGIEALSKDRESIPLKNFYKEIFKIQYYFWDEFVYFCGFSVIQLNKYFNRKKNKNEEY